MKTLSLFLASAGLLGSLTACTDGNSDSVENAQKVNEARNEANLPENAEKKADYDSEFLTKAASGGMLEVELGKLVLQRGTRADAKAFAQQMITDHSKANAELMGLAQRKHITLPTMMGNDQQDVYKDVEEKTAANFDRVYIREMRQDHEEDIKLFTEASTKAADADIRALAQKTVPVLQHHLEMVKKIEADIKASK
jgi:putative membrane protein